MELDELITLYRECGPVVAKLSLPEEYDYLFVDICDKEPNMLEIFTISREQWIRIATRHREYKEFCDFSNWSLNDWLTLIDDAPSYLTDIDLWTFPKEEFESEYNQLLLRRIAQYSTYYPERIPIKYLDYNQTLRLLQTNPELNQYCNQELLPAMEDTLKQYYFEQEAQRIAMEIICDPATN